MRLVLGSALGLLCCGLLPAQTAEPGQAEVRGIAGYAAFIDESFLDHVVAGGAAQFYLTRRFSVGPEVLFLHRDKFDKDLTVSANIAWDFLGRPRAQPYVAGHVGLLRHYGGFPGRRFATNSPEFGVGVGVKIALTRRLFVIPDFRMGTEPLFRATVGISYVLNP
jgi:hypothetical protein